LWLEGARKNLPGKDPVRKKMTGNLGRNQAQALAVHPTGRNTFRKTQIRMIGLE